MDGSTDDRLPVLVSQRFGGLPGVLVGIQSKILVCRIFDGSPWKQTKEGRASPTQRAPARNPSSDILGTTPWIQKETMSKEDDSSSVITSTGMGECKVQPTKRASILNAIKVGPPPCLIGLERSVERLPMHLASLPSIIAAASIRAGRSYVNRVLGVGECHVLTSRFDKARVGVSLFGRYTLRRYLTS